MQIDTMSAYRIYCRLPGKRNARPLGGGTLVANLIHAEIFEVRTESDAERLRRELFYLASNNPGDWELRKVKDWEVRPRETHEQRQLLALTAGVRLIVSRFDDECRAIVEREASGAIDTSTRAALALERPVRLLAGEHRLRPEDVVRLCIRVCRDNTGPRASHTIG